MMSTRRSNSLPVGTKAPRRALVIVTRRIGDVLLATPLIRSMKRAWPDTVIDALVFEGTQAIIAANPDISRIHAIRHRPGLFTHLKFLGRIARRYDLAISLVPSDRPTFYAFAAGRTRVGLLLDTRKERWKRPLLHHWMPFDPLNTHTVRMHLALSALMGIRPQADPVVAWDPEDEAKVDALLAASAARIAVLHPYPKFNYKMWSTQAWVEIATWLDARGYRVALTGGTDAAELDYVRRLAHHMPPGTLNMAGQLELGASACLVSRAAIYVGPDTALTHAAAALGVPTIALFGPTDPVKWGPWPQGHPVHLNPWRRYGSQRVGNVTLLQGAVPCAPCLNEGCASNIASFSDCLQQLPASKVIAAITQRLGEPDNNEALAIAM